MNFTVDKTTSKTQMIADTAKTYSPIRDIGFSFGRFGS